MAKTPAKVKKEAVLPDAMPLAALCALLEKNSQQIHRITKEAGIEPVSHGMFPVAGTVRAVLRHYEGKASEASTSRQSDLDRKARNDADSSDIDLANKRGLLMLKADAVALWSDERVEMRRAIQESKTIPEKMKPEVVKILQSVKLKEDGLA